jgi:hypothetical protein
MSDFNLPPGVRITDIPGNQPFDLWFDAMLDELLADDVFQQAAQSAHSEGQSPPAFAAEILEGFKR